MSLPVRIDELTTASVISAGAEVAIVAGGWTRKAPLSSFVTDAASFTQSGTGAVARTVQSKERDVVSIKDFGTGLGSEADTILALAAVGENGAVFIPEGAYTWVSTVTVDTRQHLFGAGKYATLITFTPTANDTCIEVSNGAAIANQGSIRDLTLFSGDSTYTKVGIDLIDVSNFEVDNVVIGGSVAVSGTSYWSGASSIGLRTQGREATSISNVMIAADRPIVIAANPNDTISLDHFNFHNLYLLANANPCIEVATGLNLFNISFDGYQSWVKGTHGFYWVDTTSSAQSSAISFKNVRTEQGTSATAEMFHIEHNTGLLGLRLENCYGGLDRDGIYLRKVTDVTLSGFTYIGTGVAFDADATVKRIRGLGCFWQTASTKVFAGQRLVWGSPMNPNAGALPPDFFYDESTNSTVQTTIDVPMMGSATSIAQDASATIGTAAELLGYLTVITDEDLGALYFLKGGSNGVAEINDWSATFTDSKGTATSINIFYENPSYKIENKRGSGAHSVRWIFHGANM